MLQRNIVSVFLVIFFSRIKCEDEVRTINWTIPDGEIQGQIHRTVNNNLSYCSFRGIPYAKPPVNNLRFASPIENDPWEGLHDATHDRSECTQYASGDLLGDEMLGSEDCLYINVYIPSKAIDPKANLSVLVWIHGGSFTSGNSSYVKFGPDYFLDQNLVFVSFNYRLGIFGFFSTEDGACPGNWGIKDQILALKWVQKNIAYFGGRPDNVTVFGQSAGAVSVNLLLQTKLAEGLFHGAILSSGTSLNLWGLNTRASLTSTLLGFNLGIDSSNSTELVEQLRSVNAEKIQKVGWTTVLTLFLTNALRGLPWAPVMEPNIEGAVLKDPSEFSLSQGNFSKVPVLMGMNSNEAAVFTEVPFLLKLYLLYYDVVVSYLTPYSMTKDSVKRLAAGEYIKLHFFGLLPIPTSAEKLINFVSADQFFRPIRQACTLMSQHVNAFFYIFGYTDPALGATESDTGVGHGGDLQYVFRSYDNNTKTDVQVSEMLVKLYSNFVKYGNPTPIEDSAFNNTIWPSVNASASNLDYVWLNQSMVVDVNPKQEIFEYYSEVWSTFGDETEMTTY
ncbi:unnamed protein product [Ceutorhynchus assimilis]|uniref:Carboxylic ester hydrolase n=1 Tax=Ceutorhynchus assimilis TaxID=467358 RepID=A0A9N9MGX0_9CUCU|nr:unnamed protein product [Ceutorhynchus assimilis]